MRKGRLYSWEAAALLSISITLCFGAFFQARQNELAENIIRLHVVADSDDEAEQRIKLMVRDELLSLIEPKLEQCSSAAQAREMISSCLPEIERVAAGAASGRRVSASFSEESFPRREGEGYSLPAGKYMSLRVTLGEGDGHNWWGVIFPDLTPGSTESVADASRIIGEDNVRLITDAEDYELRFKFLEWLERLGEILAAE